MRKLKQSYKNLMLLEAGYLYCIRHKFNYEKFDDLFLSEEFQSNEFDNICKDLRCYRCFKSYVLNEITEDEYEMCVDKFGE